MSRFFIKPENWDLDRLFLDEAETHHALGVLRLREGDKAVVFNGRGLQAEVEIVSVGKHSIQLRRLTNSESKPLSAQITLAQAIPKGKNMELVVQKATELGAAEIVPLLTERTVVQLDERDLARKRDKWQGTVVEACKQCGQNWMPQVRTPVTLERFLKEEQRFDLMLVASLQPGSKHLKAVLADYQADHQQELPKKVLILIGPEGDFTPEEIEYALQSGCQPITLGPIVLRTETAAIYCLSVLGHELFG